MLESNGVTVREWLPAGRLVPASSIGRVECTPVRLKAILVWPTGVLSSETCTPVTVLVVAYAVVEKVHACTPPKSLTFAVTGHGPVTVPVVTEGVLTKSLLSVDKFPLNLGALGSLTDATLNLDIWALLLLPCFLFLFCFCRPRSNYNPRLSYPYL